MFRRMLMAVAAAVAFVVPLVLVATTPASACVLGCQNGGIVVSPHSGNAGTWTAHLPPAPYTQVRVVTISWQVTNTNGHAVEVAVTAGATGCAAKAPPYVSPSSLSLDADESATVYTYVKYSCIGEGTAWAGAGQDQGSQSITFVTP